MKQELIKLVENLEEEAKECLKSKTGIEVEDAYFEGSADALEHVIALLNITLSRN